MFRFNRFLNNAVTIELSCKIFYCNLSYLFKVSVKPRFDNGFMIPLESFARSPRHCYDNVEGKHWSSKCLLRLPVSASCLGG